MKNLIGLIGGLLFSVGLVVSGMINPKKVIGFLDAFGDWDMSLAFVMGGAVIVNLIVFRLILKREPVYNDKHNLPASNRHITKRLVIGSVLFGIGWGLVGICPGPAIVNLVTLQKNAVLFVAAMLVGMLAFKYLDAFFAKESGE